MAKLAAYLAKRDFKKTPEPSGQAGEDSGVGFSFVIQKHAASRLHYDLRLELDGVMKSWAVTKGPSLVPGEKRLAVHVEDHPIEYNTFEGTIPKGQYGGGTVLIWDRGRWEPEGDPHRGMAKGHLDFSLDGEKLHGRFHLVRLKPRPGEKQEPWLLIKSDDAHARDREEPDILEELPLSIVTGRSLDEIAQDRDSAVWNSNRGLAAEERETKKEEGKVAPKGRAASKAKAKAAPPRPDEEPAAAPVPPASGRRKAPMPKEVEPCLATLAAEVPKGETWLHEIKWDGYRLIAFKARGQTRIATRRGHDWTPRFPSIAEAVNALPVETAILDGEAVIEDERGVSDFSALQNALSDEHGRVARNAIFFAFDLLYLEGEDLRALPLDARKARLATLVPPGETGFLRLSEHVEGDGGAMVKSACQLGLEGVISKRRDRPYRSGRGEDWLKIKCTSRQEFVIGGYVPSKAAKRAVGSLVLGYYEDGALRHAGRTGTGFTAESSREIWRKLDAIARPASPFTGKLSAEDRRGAIWVDPALVAEVEFPGWTADGHLRHASFKGLREDKLATEVVREKPNAAASAAGVGTAKASPPARPSSTVRSKAGRQVAGVALTNPDRVLWSEGITKGELATFYESIAEWLLPQVADRPLSLVRCPNGAEQGCFFQKHSWAGLGEDIRRETVREPDGEEEVLYVQDIRGVMSLVQASVLEIHPWGSTIADVEKPDRIVMDLDPGPGVEWTDIVAGALDIRERLAGMKLESFVKTTGGKGLHVVIPLTPRAAWPEVKAFAQALASTMEADAPNRYIAKATKQARRGLIYVDYLRNGRGATAIAAYSTRARPGAPVAVPVRWDELTPDLSPNQFTIANLSKRLGTLKRDPWAGMAKPRQVLPDLKARAPRRVRNQVT